MTTNDTVGNRRLVSFIGLVASLLHSSIFLMPFGAGAYGPGVPLGWPPRLIRVSYVGGR